ncbi:hypothetical protein B0H11DRAFT_2111045 [Mycena galericulata]|nr:hypothetical protein B0H11DRAFT_2111045 [Mycena galericulata]
MDSHPADTATAYSTDIDFPDGNLILQAANVCFRVYGGFLGDRSPVFRDMLSFPQPADADLMDGVSVVHLSDTPKDLAVFLKALFRYEFFAPYPERTDFDTIFSVLRLSAKYQVGELYKRSLIHLSSACPTERPHGPISSSWDVQDSTWIPIILLARDMGIDWILPFAMYKACEKLRTVDLLRGVDHNGVHVQLDDNDQLKCLEQSLELRTSATVDIVAFLWTDDEISGCEERGDCHTARYLALQEVEARRSYNLMLPLNLWSDNDWRTLDVCETCVAFMKAHHAAALDRFWYNLPERFGLAPWATLELARNMTIA